MPLHPIVFIGTGIMGLPMARHLTEAGYPLKVYNRTSAKAVPAKTFVAQIVKPRVRPPAVGRGIIIVVINNLAMKYSKD